MPLESPLDATKASPAVQKHPTPPQSPRGAQFPSALSPHAHHTTEGPNV